MEVEFVGLPAIGNEFVEEMEVMEVEFVGIPTEEIDFLKMN